VESEDNETFSEEDKDDKAFFEKISFQADSPLFETFIEQIQNGEASEEDSNNFDIIIMMRFCSKVYKKESIEPWIMNYFADNFYKILLGSYLNEEFNVPWDPKKDDRSRTEKRNIKLFCDIENERRNGTGKIVDIINETALKYNCSFEVARDTYYKFRKNLS